MARSKEFFWWSLFSAGGMVDALVLPAMFVVTGVLVPAGLVSAEALYNIVHHPLGRLFLFVVIAPSLFHWAHRARHTAIDLGLSALAMPIALVCYGAAILGTVLGGWWLIRL